MTKKVLIISFHFYPSMAVGAKRPAEMAATLRDNGFEVAVLAASCDKSSSLDQALAERVRDLEIAYVPVPPKIVDSIWGWVKRRRVPPNNRAPTPNSTSSARKETPIRKLRRYYNSMDALFDRTKLWCFLAFLRLVSFRVSRGFDLIISSGPPMSVHLLGMLAKSMFGARWVVDLRDPWIGHKNLLPETFSQLRIGLESMTERRALRLCDLIVCASPGIEKYVLRRNHWAERKLATVYNGFDEPVRLNPKPKRGELTLLYAGTLYLHRNPLPLLEAFANLLAQPGVEREKVTLNLVGNCARWGPIDLRAWVKEKALADRVKISPPVDSHRIAALMSEAHVLVNFSQGQPDQIPAKTFDYIGAGKEMLVIAEKDSDTGMLVRECGVGRIVDPTDHHGMNKALRDLYQYYVVDRRTYAVPVNLRQRYSRQAQNSKYLDLIRQML